MSDNADLIRTLKLLGGSHPEPDHQQRAYREAAAALEEAGKPIDVTVGELRTKCRPDVAANYIQMHLEEIRDLRAECHILRLHYVGVIGLLRTLPRLTPMDGETWLLVDEAIEDGEKLGVPK